MYCICKLFALIVPLVALAVIIFGFRSFEFLVVAVCLDFIDVFDLLYVEWFDCCILLVYLVLTLLLLMF